MAELEFASLSEACCLHVHHPLTHSTYKLKPLSKLSCLKKTIISRQKNIYALSCTSIYLFMNEHLTTTVRKVMQPKIVSSMSKILKKKKNKGFLLLERQGCRLLWQSSRGVTLPETQWQGCHLLCDTVTGVTFSVTWVPQCRLHSPAYSKKYVIHIWPLNSLPTTCIKHSSKLKQATQQEMRHTHNNICSNEKTV